MRRFLHRYLEYLLLVVVAACAAGAVTLFARSQSEAKPASRATSRSCAEAGITAASEREGRCRTATAELTVVRSGHVLQLPGLEARVRGTDVVLPRTPAGRAHRRARVVVRLAVRNTGASPLFAAGADQAVYLVAHRQRIDPDRHAAALPGAFPVDEPLAPGGLRSGELHFELFGAQARADAPQLGIRPAGPGHIGVIRLALSAG